MTVDQVVFGPEYWEPTEKRPAVQRAARFTEKRPAEFTPVPRYGTLRKMRARSCFRNAFHVASSRPGMSYAEGLAQNKDGLWIHHAWNVDAEEHAVDVTWPVPGERYVGVILSTKEVSGAILESGCLRWGPVLDEAMMDILLATADPSWQSRRLWPNAD